MAQDKTPLKDMDIFIVRKVIDTYFGGIRFIYGYQNFSRKKSVSTKLTEFLIGFLGGDAFVIEFGWVAWGKPLALQKTFLYGDRNDFFFRGRFFFRCSHHISSFSMLINDMNEPIHFLIFPHS